MFHPKNHKKQNAFHIINAIHAPNKEENIACLPISIISLPFSLP
ncbi:hypothetical protein HanXRQr2_Chr17g0779691 [Helianthus annuus]|uniref:Uncharacterized protein n=1 Tax=Helianthus annuus TaxID=4232 RepID=A0A9K3DGF9_HELAN|nr:hypothetical protein HanXRQr2_Chr17g0779691 [Helianthus annuus]KAJ0811193.1 hypothetical protein HanPSC8_Chr17g0748061 [Helianthus annuus]